MYRVAPKRRKLIPHTTFFCSAELVKDGIISWIKYAIVREHPDQDPFLSELTQLVNPDMIVSGIGEQPAPVHLQNFGVGGFTSGCVCVQPALSAQMLIALKAGDRDRAEAIRAQFSQLEDLRNAHGPIPVLHHAVAGAEISMTGPHLPLLSSLPEPLVAEIGAAALALRNLSIDA